MTKEPWTMALFCTFDVSRQWWLGGDSSIVDFEEGWATKIIKRQSFGKLSTLLLLLLLWVLH